MARMLDSSTPRRPEDLAAYLAPVIAMVLVALTGFACLLPI